MNLSSFYQPSAAGGSAASFKAVGDSVSGPICAEPAMMDDKYRPGEQVLTVTVQPNHGEPVTIWARSHMVQAIGEAVQDAGADELVKGGALTVVYSDNKQLQSGRVMKIYRAKYEPPVDDASVPW